MNSYYENLPKKRMASGALFFDEENKLLIVKPTYRDYWLIPGGVIDKDESPLDCCVREVKEELGLDFTREDFQFLGVDYKEKTEQSTESLQFIFYGGFLSREQIANIVFPRDELSEIRFEIIEKALPLFHKRMARRVESALRFIGKNGVYLENGI